MLAPNRCRHAAGATALLALALVLAHPAAARAQTPMAGMAHTHITIPAGALYTTADVEFWAICAELIDSSKLRDAGSDCHRKTTSRSAPRAKLNNGVFQTLRSSKVTRKGASVTSASARSAPNQLFPTNWLSATRGPS